MGEWIYKENPVDRFGFGCRVCSSCLYMAQHHVLRADKLEWKYCPMCGEKMTPCDNGRQKLGLTD